MPSGRIALITEWWSHLIICYVYLPLCILFFCLYILFLSVRFCVCMFLCVLYVIVTFVTFVYFFVIFLYSKVCIIFHVTFLFFSTLCVFMCQYFSLFLLFVCLFVFAIFGKFFEGQVYLFNALVCVLFFEKKLKFYFKCLCREDACFIGTRWVLCNRIRFDSIRMWSSLV